MAFGGQMHHGIGGMGFEDPVQRRPVADIGMFELVQRAVGHGTDIFQIGRIGQRIQVDHAMARPHGMAHHGGSDESCPAGYKYLHVSLRR